MNVVLLFGAGASAFSGACHPSCPPLGDGLFDALYNEGLPASSLDKKHIDVFRKDGFEAGMDSVAELGSQFVVPLQKQLAIFLSKFEIRAENHYLNLVKHLGDQCKQICFSTLNYDVLLEQALSQHGILFNCNPYKNSETNAQVLKPHGSSNFLPRLPKHIHLNNIETGVRGSIIEGFGTDVVTSHNEIVKWCEDAHHNAIPPAMSLYAKGKNCLANSKDIEQIQDHWGEIVMKAKLVVLIGVRCTVEDTHIWEPIKKSKCRLAVVDPNKSEIREWAANNGGQYIFNYGDCFGSSISKICNSISATL